MGRAGVVMTCATFSSSSDPVVLSPTPSAAAGKWLAGEPPWLAASADAAVAAELYLRLTVR